MAVCGINGRNKSVTLENADRQANEFSNYNPGQLVSGHLTFLPEFFGENINLPIVESLKKNLRNLFPPPPHPHSNVEVDKLYKIFS